MGTNKKYRLLKDLPGLKAGVILGQARPGGAYSSEDKHYPAFSVDQVELNSDWFEEVKEPPTIPEDQAWVVPGKKYRHEGWPSNRYFIPSLFNFSKNYWDGVSGIVGMLTGMLDGANRPIPYFKNKYDFETMTCQEEWEEYVAPEKPKRLAPAYFYYTNDNDISVSQWLFASKEEAIARLGRNFKGWPALPDSDGFYPGPKVQS